MSVQLSQAIADQLNNPSVARCPDGAVFLVQEQTAGLSAKFVAMAAAAESKTALNLMGGCSNMETEDRIDMMEFIGKAMEGLFTGVVLSGSTRNLTDNGLVDPMITEIPGMIARLNPGAVAIGTAPRTETMRMFGDRIALGQGGNLLNHSFDGILLVQDGSDNDADWDGDLKLRLDTLRTLRDYSRYQGIANLSWNGGGVTQKEIVAAVTNGFPIIMIEGSGRKTDEVIDAYKKGDFSLFNGKEPKGFHVVKRGDVDGLRNAMRVTGILN